MDVHVRHKPDRAHLLLYYTDPATGREVSKSAGTANRKEAERAAALWEQELFEFRGANNDGWEYFRQRFESEHAAMLARRTQKALVTALNHFERLMNVSAVSDVTPNTLSLFTSLLHKEDRPATSIANYLTHLRVALNWAEKVGMIRKAPKVSMPKTGKRRFMRGRPVTEVEYLAMLEACEAPWKRFLELLWLSGLRLEEGMRCSWEAPPVSVDLTASPYPQIVFHVEGQKSRQDEAAPMTPDFAAWLSKTPPEARTGLVAPIPLESSARVSEFVSAIGEAAGVVVNEKGKFASAHDLRRAFGTRWAAIVRPLTLQRMMRHASISTTLRYYVGMSSADAGAELWADSQGYGNGARQ